MKPGDAVAVLKLDLAGKERWRYPAKVLEAATEGLLVEAFFNRPDDLPFHGITFHPGDRFLEAYYTSRRFNIFEVYDRDSAKRKCWYCNASRPAVAGDLSISYVDLALDLMVFPGGRQLLLDEDEFAALAIEPGEREETLQAMRNLQARFREVGGINLAGGGFSKIIQD